MTFDSKRKKAKAAKSAPAPTGKDPKADTKKPTPATATRALPRKRAADFLSSDEEDEKAWAGIEGKSGGKSKGKKSSTASRKKAKKEEKPEEPAPDPKESSKSEGILSSVAGGSDSADSQDEGVDDQTAMLLKGFESSDEEEEEDEEREGPGSTKFKNAKVPKHKETKKLGALVGRGKTTPGIVYVGRIPHGFYEHEMRSYFSQFGEVTRLRLSRNKKTGHSKHYAFIEFADSDVAKIVTETMDNYLMFGHILKCKIVPRLDPEAVERLFIGANRRFKPRPGAKLQKAMLEKKKTKEGWEMRGWLENKKRKGINKRLREKGIDYEFDVPEVKAPDLILDTPTEDAQAVVEI